MRLGMIEFGIGNVHRQREKNKMYIYIGINIYWLTGRNGASNILDWTGIYGDGWRTLDYHKKDLIYYNNPFIFNGRYILSQRRSIECLSLE
jgi:hypothetical protein